MEGAVGVTVGMGLRVGQIRIGAAREEGRAPSHDGEYLSVYYRAGRGEYIVTHNAGVAWTDESDAEDRDGELDVEAQEIVAQDRGEPATGHIGAEELDLMVSAGWVMPCEACDRMGGATVVTVREAVAAAAGVGVDEVGELTFVAHQGDVDWSIWPIADGRWAATDDSEVAVDRVEVYGSRRDAVEDLFSAYLTYAEDDPQRPTWTGPRPDGIRTFDSFAEAEQAAAGGSIYCHTCPREVRPGRIEYAVADDLDASLLDPEEWSLADGADLAAAGAQD